MKKEYWLLLIVNVAVFLLLKWAWSSGPTAMPYHRQTLSQVELDAAIKTLSQERLRWSQFTNMSAKLDVLWDTGEALSGNVSLRQLGPGSDPWEFEMRFSNQDQGWTITTDSQHGNTQFECSDKTRAQWLTNTGPTMLLFMTFPKQMLLGICSDQALPFGRTPIAQLTSVFSITRNQTNNQTSYVWKPFESKVFIRKFSLQNGHLVSWNTKKWAEWLDVSAPVDGEKLTNAFCFPPNLRFQLGTNICNMKFSNVVVNIN